MSDKTPKKISFEKSFFFKNTEDIPSELKRTIKGGKIVLPDDYIHQVEKPKYETRNPN